MTSEVQPTGGDLLARSLKAAGVRHVFALHGGHLEAFFKGCVEQGIDLIDFRHEAAAGHAADAYARATGALGVCAITAGPGFANAMSAIVNAQLDGSPTLFIIGAPPLREAETNPLQGGFDQIAMARPAVKWAHRITNTERIPDLAAMAIRKAMTGRRGAVLLELPIDVLHMSAPPKVTTAPAGVLTRPRPAPSPSEAKALLDLLLAAERPVIVAGGDALHSRCGAALQAFAERSGIPVFWNGQAVGMLPTDHKLAGGAAGNLAALPLLGRPAPDAALLLGARLGLLLGGRSGAIVPNAAKLAQVYPDAGELGRIRDVDVAIAADSGATLEALLEISRTASFPDWSAWREAALSIQHMRASLFPERETAGSIHPYHAAKAALDAAGPEAAYALDGGEAASWGGDVARVSGPGRVLSHGYLGCLGIGPGFAIGLQTAFPERRVIHLTGDGAMGFHLQEFDTMARRRLQIVTVILNNRVWGMSIHGQQIMYGPNYNVITTLGETRYSDVARAFGLHGERVERYDEIAPAMARALASGRPACVEIMTDAAVIHPITASMLGAGAKGSGDIMIPYYENIPA